MKPEYRPSNPNFEKQVSDSFNQQKFMSFIGAKLSVVKPGFCEIHLPYQEYLGQQHGYFHAGIIGTLADNSAGYAAYSLMPKGYSILSVEYKINLLRPGKGELLVAKAEVVKAGKSLSVCRSDIFILENGKEKLCATAQVTLMGKPV